MCGMCVSMQLEQLSLLFLFFSLVFSFLFSLSAFCFRALDMYLKERGCLVRVRGR